MVPQIGRQAVMFAGYRPKTKITWAPHTSYQTADAQMVSPATEYNDAANGGRQHAWKAHDGNEATGPGGVASTWLVNTNTVELFIYFFSARRATQAYLSPVGRAFPASYKVPANTQVWGRKVSDGTWVQLGSVAASTTVGVTIPLTDEVCDAYKVRYAGNGNEYLVIGEMSFTFIETERFQNPNRLDRTWGAVQVTLGLDDMKFTSNAPAGNYCTKVFKRPIQHGKKYFEVLAEGTIEASLTFLQILDGPGYVDLYSQGGNFHGYGQAFGLCYRPGGQVLGNGSWTNAAWSYTAGDLIGVALDTATKQVWLRKNGGTWWGASAGTVDPVASLGGFLYGPADPEVRGQELYLPGASAAPGGAWTFNLGRTGFAHAMPSGYSAVDPEEQL